MTGLLLRNVASNIALSEKIDSQDEKKLSFSDRMFEVLKQQGAEQLNKQIQAANPSVSLGEKEIRQMVMIYDIEKGNQTKKEIPLTSLKLSPSSSSYGQEPESLQLDEEDLISIAEREESLNIEPDNNSSAIIEPFSLESENLS